MDKKTIRELIREKRINLTVEAREAASHKIFNLISNFEIFTKSAKIGFYLSYNGEIDLNLIIKLALKLNKNIYLPVLNNKNLKFYLYNSKTKLNKNIFGILEPVLENSDHEILGENLDLVFLPLVAGDKNGNRVGMGKGFYDQTFKNLTEPKPVLVGVGYDFQLFANLPRDDWDVKLDYLVVESQLVNCNAD